MEKMTVNNQSGAVKDIIKGFEVLSKESNNVEYYGTDGANVFVQFKNGSSYMYANVDPADIEGMKAAESIGRFIPVLKKYPATKYEYRLVVMEPVESK